MDLTAGTRIGVYEIISQLGEGGMGVVFRARDTKLQRDVALKALPDRFADDADRLSRFQREAQVLASLNHPHIAQVYGLEDSGDSACIVMELVEGETLQELLKRGPIAFDDALSIAKQIAQALITAHEKGIIHRDLKPANIKITPEGNVKVLDFGLAKVFQQEGQLTLSNSPTLMGASVPGLILGTAAYMSPEQAKGKEADRVSDVWAFGCVLYEILTGSAAFEGETISEIFAHVLRGEPDWNRLPEVVPEDMRRLLRWCLQKNRTVRLHDMADVWIQLEDTRPDTDTSKREVKGFKKLPWVLLGAVVVFAIAISKPAIDHLIEPQPARVQFLIDVPPTAASNQVSISPDGRYVTFVATADSGRNQLFLRHMDSTSAQALPGTEAASNPFWSPDSRSIAFFADGHLKRLELAGGMPQTICAGGGNSAWGTWNAKGTIVFSTGGTLHRVAAAGGISENLTALDGLRGETAHIFPVFLPDGDHFLYLVLANETYGGLYMKSLAGKETSRVMPLDSMVAYVEPGYLLFQRQGTLYAQPFDAPKGTVTGDAIRIADKVNYVLGGRAAFSASQNGVLVYRGGRDSTTELSWYDRTGNMIGTPVGTGKEFSQVNLSADGNEAAVQIGQTVQTSELWLLDLIRGIPTRFTFGSGDADPIWSPDAKRILFTSRRQGVGHLYWKPIGSGGEEILLSLQSQTTASDWSKDGKNILYLFQTEPGKQDVYYIRTDSDRQPLPFLKSPYNKDEARFSPDGRWVAYNTDESGKYEVFVAAFPGAAEKLQISNGGGVQPTWRADGKELFYLTLDGKMMALDISGNADLKPGIPKMLFQSRVQVRTQNDQYAVSKDGRRFLLITPVAEARPIPINVVLNWTSGLDKK